MLALRQIVEDPGDFIPVPPEVKHKRTEVIFLLVDQPSISEDQLLLAALAGSWSGSLEREPQGEYEQRLELE